MVQIVLREKKGPVLKRPAFGCLKRFYALNVTNGCLHRCVYCYARGYSQAPPAGKVELYANLPQLLASELDNPRRRKRPELVVFNTASDCFQPHPEIQRVTREVLAVLLKRRVMISFLTKGLIPRETLDLLAERPELVRAQVGLVSLSEGYWRTFEPFAPSPERRLAVVEGLRRAGVETEVRIDPVIPFVTDMEDEIRRLLTTLRALGVRRVTVSYLHLRPAIEGFLKKELGEVWRRIEVCFKNQPWRTVGLSTRSKLVPLPLRRRGYARFERIGAELGLEVVVCSCKNPDLGGGLCVPPPSMVAPRQLRLF